MYYEPVNVYYAIGGMKLITDGWVWLVACFDANIFLHTTTFPIIVRMVYTNFTVRKFEVRFLKFLFPVLVLISSLSHTFPGCLYFCRSETASFPRPVF